MQRARRTEAAFLAGVEANLERAKGRLLPGRFWTMLRGDQGDELRAQLKAHHRHAPSVIDQLPRNRRVVLLGFERRWWFLRRLSGVTVASVLTPLDHVAAGSDAPVPPVDVGELVDHVRSLVGEPEVPHIIGICAPGGFTDEARNSQLDLPNITLVLVEPGAQDGWRITGLGDDVPEFALSLFDPEETSRKLDRVRREIEERGADLLVGGLNAAAVGRRFDLPEAVVVEAFEQAASADPELRVSRCGTDVLLIRGARAAGLARSGSVLDRIRALFDGEGDEARKIATLSEQRASLAERRDRIYEHLVQLEKREAALLDEGRQTSSNVTRQRLAGQIAQLRKEVARQNVLAGMLATQIDIISTDIHNLSLIVQGEAASLPDTEELTRNAVRAEEMLETLHADADLAGALEIGITDTVTSEEERVILAEFEAGDAAEPVSPLVPGAPETRRSRDEPAAPAPSGESAGVDERRRGDEPAGRDEPADPTRRPAEPDD